MDTEHLKQQLRSINCKPTTEEMNKRVQEMRTKKNGLVGHAETKKSQLTCSQVIEYWTKNKERMRDKKEEQTTAQKLEDTRFPPRKLNSYHIF